MEQSKNNNSKDKMTSGRGGQMLVEAIVAISVLTVGFFGVLSLLSQSLSLNRVVTDNYTATYLAAEGMEIIKNLVDANSTLRKAGSSASFGLARGCYEVTYETTSLPSLTSCDVGRANPLNFDSNANFYNYGIGGRPTAFRRIVEITTSRDGNEVGVNSVVSWTTRGGGAFSVNLEDHFMRWQPFWSAP